MISAYFVAWLIAAGMTMMTRPEKKNARIYRQMVNRGCGLLYCVAVRFIYNDQISELRI